MKTYYDNKLIIVYGTSSIPKTLNNCDYFNFLKELENGEAELIPYKDETGIGFVQESTLQNILNQLEQKRIALEIEKLKQEEAAAAIAAEQITIQETANNQNILEEQERQKQLEAQMQQQNEIIKKKQEEQQSLESEKNRILAELERLEAELNT